LAGSKNGRPGRDGLGWSFLSRRGTEKENRFQQPLYQKMGRRYKLRALGSGCGWESDGRLEIGIRGAVTDLFSKTVFRGVVDWLAIDECILQSAIFNSSEPMCITTYTPVSRPPSPEDTRPKKERRKEHRKALEYKPFFAVYSNTVLLSGQSNPGRILSCVQGALSVPWLGLLHKSQREVIRIHYFFFHHRSIPFLIMTEICSVHEPLRMGRTGNSSYPEPSS